MVQNGEEVNDGADEKMLHTDKENLAKKEEVKFISGEQNGDAKIDIGALNKAFTGMTKEELMKYANDPFWVRLRWIFFILFWAIWIGMLIGAILIIINAPKCAAPTPLVWWKQGPLLKMNTNEVSPNDVDQAKIFNAKGVIYELSIDDTYSVKKPNVEEKIKRILSSYANTDINVILDITPNYVTKNFELFNEALNDETKRSAFIWVDQPDIPNNWRSIVNGSAWDEVKPQSFVLNQFGDGKYDLYMNNSVIKGLLNETLQHLLNLGIKGFRLENAKHFILNKNLQNEMPASEPNSYIHDQYGFWTHSQTTFQDDLASFLYELSERVRNASNGEAFLTVSDDTVRPEVFKIHTGEFAVDTPIYGRFPHYLGLRTSTQTKNLYKELKNTMDAVGNNTWLQWIYELENLGSIDPTAYNLFMMLLPGVPVLNLNESFYITGSNASLSLQKQLENLRQSPTYMHGNFDLYHSGDSVAYSRFKAGNPGFFVVLNPTSEDVSANFSSVGLPEKMTFDLFSYNYNSTGAVLKGKVSSDAIPLSPYSAAVLTYVPVRKE